LFFTILIAVIAVAGSLLTAQALGFKPLAILSGSMEPAYRVYGLVIVDTNAKPEDISAGDVIAFQLNENTTVTHRVTDVDEGARLFSTKGDANDSADLSPVPFDNMVGRAGLHVPWLGYVLMNMKTPTGIAIGVILLALLIALFAIPAILTPDKRPDKRVEEAGNE
jgi:signal peptidase